MRGDMQAGTASDGAISEASQASGESDIDDWSVVSEGLTVLVPPVQGRGEKPPDREGKCITPCSEPEGMGSLHNLLVAAHVVKAVALDGVLSRAQLCLPTIS